MLFLSSTAKEVAQIKLYAVILIGFILAIATVTYYLGYLLGIGVTYTYESGNFSVYKYVLNGKFGISIDKEMVTKPIYEDIRPLSEGLSAITINKKTGFIDGTGKVVIDPIFISALSFKNGISIIELPKGIYGAIDVKGNYILKPQYISLAIHDNMFCAKNEDGKYGFIYPNGDRKSVV